MKFFLDSANPEQVQEVLRWGLLDGVTTNPSLLAKTGQPYAEVLRRICALVKGPVSAEVVATEGQAMLEQGLRLSELGANIVVKCPATLEGLRATQALARRNVKVNVTLVFSVLQALAAAKCGASYLSLFVGRLEDLGQDGFSVVEQTERVLRDYGFPTQLLVASLRSPAHVLRAAQAGADIATIPFGIFQQMLVHPLTETGLAVFLKDWQASGQKIG